MDKTLLKGLMVLEAVTDVDNPPRTIDALAARVGLTRSHDEQVDYYTKPANLDPRRLRHQGR